MKQVIKLEAELFLRIDEIRAKKTEEKWKPFLERMGRARKKWNKLWSVGDNGSWRIEEVEGNYESV